MNWITTSVEDGFDNDILVLPTGRTPWQREGLCLYELGPLAADDIVLGPNERECQECFWQWAVGTRGSKAMMDLEQSEKVKLIDKTPRIPSRQSDHDAGGWWWRMRPSWAGCHDL
jgi:hypothetical protein